MLLLVPKEYGWSSIFKPFVAYRPVLVHLIIDLRASALLPVTARWITAWIAEALLLLVVKYPQTGETSMSHVADQID
jgi:hypothetical protein